MKNKTFLFVSCLCLVSFLSCDSGGGRIQGGNNNGLPNTPTVADPQFSPNNGSIVTVGSTVSISSATDGATIMYTVDNSTPGESNGLVYSQPITINTAMTIKAIAMKEGTTDSAVGLASYSTANPGTPCQSGYWSSTGNVPCNSCNVVADATGTSNGTSCNCKATFTWDGGTGTCICPSGTVYNSYNDSCAANGTPCPANYWSTSGTLPCTNCSIGNPHASGPNANSGKACACQAGYVWSTSTHVCEPQTSGACPSGFWSTNGYAPCTSCNFIADATGPSNGTACTCKATFVWNTTSHTCVCPSGTVYSSNSDSCVSPTTPCSNTNWSPTGVEPCTNCSIGNPHATGLSTTNRKACVCYTGFTWNTSAHLCQ
jgi:hypothetical protein